MGGLYTARAGEVSLEGLPEYHNPEFGYTLWEGVIDPANPDGPRAIAMHVPPRSMSRAWQLIEEDYSESVELLEGSANLFVGFAATPEIMVYHLTPDNPVPYNFAYGNELEISQGDAFCVLTEEEPTVVLSRPSKHFDIAFEWPLTEKPTDPMARFILKTTTRLRELAG
jgi:hypothetical protein